MPPPNKKRVVKRKRQQRGKRSQQPTNKGQGRKKPWYRPKPKEVEPTASQKEWAELLEAEAADWEGCEMMAREQYYMRKELDVTGSKE